MVFSSTVFMFLFLPITLIGYYNPIVRSRGWKNLWLLVLSIGFYAWGEPKMVLLMLMSILVNWFLGLFVVPGTTRGKVMVTLAVCYNLGVLFLFKYLNFACDNLNYFLGLTLSVRKIALPIGVSFFTFQSMSYVIDVYRGKGEKQKNPLNIGLYISFFPQLIAGPIVRYETVAAEIKHRKENWHDFCEGMVRFLLGVAKKVLISNQVALIADQCFGTVGDLSVAMAWTGALAYTLQIYFDFSGYSDMAIGLGQMFGFHFLENFDYPYMSKSVTEFWRRWHISLGTWFRDYVYFPLGGSRVNSKTRLIFNLFVVWSLTGIWHGANWTFILWGIMYFVLLAIEKLIGLPQKVGKVGHIYTLFWVIIGWVIFRADNMGMAFSYIGQMFGLSGNVLVNAVVVDVWGKYGLWMLLGILFSMPVKNWITAKLGTNKCWTGWVYGAAVLALAVLSIAAIANATYNPFIYFNF